MNPTHHDTKTEVEQFIHPQTQEVTTTRVKTRLNMETARLKNLATTLPVKEFTCNRRINGKDVVLSIPALNGAEARMIANMIYEERQHPRQGR